MKEDELRKYAKCLACSKGVGRTGLPLFWTATVKRHGLLKQGLDQTMGLTTFFGGGSQGAALARIMGANPELTQEMTSVEFSLCEHCAMEPQNLMSLVERANELSEKETP